VDRGRDLTVAALFICIEETMKSAVAYIDGFNLYHAIDNLGQPHLKWLDLWTLSRSFLRQDEVLIAVNYFSAYATWMPASYARHRKYVEALENAGVTIFMGKFKERNQKCHSCKKEWTAHEEKETDVHISTRIVADAFQDKFDRAILISADSDLAPPLRVIRAETNKQVLVVAPPKRLANGRGLNPALEVTLGRLRNSLFPERITKLGGGIISRPIEYCPPVPVIVPV